MKVPNGVLAGTIGAIVLAWACTPTPQEVVLESLDTGSGSSTTTGGPADGSSEDTGPPTGPVCGDGVIEGDEECDLGPDNGNGDYCLDDCSSNECGDGYVGPGEVCDDGNTNDEDDCTNQCGLASCGDGIVQAPEECDLGEDNSLTGACLPSCLNATCGDQNIHMGVEVCDSDDVAGNDCAGQGFDGGTLLCGADCTTFDTSNCFVCGNGMVEANEDCDMADFRGLTCADYGVGTPSGSLSCNLDCSVDSSACTFCGDGTVEGSEVCDDMDFGGATCASLGFDGGTLSCNAACSMIDDTACYACGDGMIEGPEQCEAGDLDGQSCMSITGLPEGDLDCDGSCMFDVSDCSDCGNGTREGGEVCDGADLDGETCSTVNIDLDGDGLACDMDCSEFNISGCCSANGVGCALNGECCSGDCDSDGSGTCVCLMAGESCTQNAACCTGSCGATTAGQCD